MEETIDRGQFNSLPINVQAWVNQNQIQVLDVHIGSCICIITKGMDVEVLRTMPLPIIDIVTTYLNTYQYTFIQK